MKKKWKKIVIAGMAGILMMMLAGCKEDESAGGAAGEFYDCQHGFRNGVEYKICETPDGYYMLVGNYLVFAEKDLSKTAIVCNKAECLHCEEAIDNKANCNAFFSSPEEIGYYDGKLYILSKDFSVRDGGMCIFEVAADGSSRKNIYKGGEGTNSFAIHRGNVYVYEQKYADENGKVYKTPHISIEKFSLKNPKKTSVLLETGEYEHINRLVCYENYCYFSANYPEKDGVAQDWAEMKINLDTGEVSVCEELFDYAIGEGFLFNRIVLEMSEDGYAWKSGYNRCTLDGKVEKTYTEQDFDIIGKDTVGLLGADDKYIYFKDIGYGDNMVPLEEQKIYVYTYDGDFVCEIPTEGIAFPQIYMGNDKYMFWNDNGDGNGMKGYYYIDKELFGKGAKVEKFMSADLELFNSSCAFSYK